MINVLFEHPPKLDSNPSSYFTAVLEAHEWIKNDLKGVVRADVPKQGDTTLEQVHESLSTIEKMLFGSQTEYPLSVKGCCLYTEDIEMRLKSSGSSCTVH